MSFTDKPAVVIDNGTGYTKMGYAGNLEPNYIIPTLIANPLNETGTRGTVRNAEGLSDLDFYIGNEAQERQSTYQINYPIKHGIIENCT